MLKNYLTAEQSGEEILSIVNAVRGGIPSAVFGVSFSEKCHVASATGLPALYIVKDGVYASKIVEELKGLTGEEVVYLPPKDDVLLFKTAFEKSRFYERLSAIYKIQRGAKYVVATFESLLQLFPKKIPTVEIKRGQTLDPYSLISVLTKMGYRREEFAEEKATFALRGDIFEIYPVNGDNIYRVDFFGDEVETVTEYEKGDKEEKTIVSGFTAIAATDAIIDENDRQTVKDRLRESVLKFKTLAVKDDARRIAAEISEKIDDGACDDSFQFILPILPSVTSDILSYMSPETVIVYDECKMLSDSLSALIKEHTERVLTLSRAGRAMDFTILQLSDSNRLIERLNGFRRMALQNITTAVNFFNPLKTFNVKCSPVARYSAKPDDLLDRKSVV